MEPAILTPNIINRARTPLAAAARWGADPASVEHVSDGASFTYRLRLDGAVHYLRLTPPSWQSAGELRGEISFIRAVRSAGISTPLPVRSLSGEFIERVADGEVEFLAVVFEEAPGRPLDPEDWDEGRITRWGRLLAELHDAAPRTLPDGESRKDWRDDLPQILNWLPDDETDAHNHLARVNRWLQSLPQGPDVYGLVHFDLMGDNVLWVESSPTVIDFDDLMFTWFAADIARALGTFRSETPERRQAMTVWLLNGYQQVRRLDPVSAEFLSEFVRLISIGSLAWNLYSRSRGVGSMEGRQDAENLRNLIADPRRWGL